MKWQDLVVTAGAWVFIIALYPSVKSEDKPAFVTSLITGVTMLAYTIVYASYSLWWATASSVILCFEWFVLAHQKYRQQCKL